MPLNPPIIYTPANPGKFLGAAGTPADPGGFVDAARTPQAPGKFSGAARTPQAPGAFPSGVFLPSDPGGFDSDDGEQPYALTAGGDVFTMSGEPLTQGQPV